MGCNLEQQHIIDDFKRNPASFTLIQGKGGTGKSYMIKELVRRISGDIVLTPTNMAKSMSGRIADTIHSFFYGEFDDIDKGISPTQKGTVPLHMYFPDFG